MRKKPAKKPEVYYGAIIRCDTCGTTLQSKHHHDWVSCPCYRNSESNTGVFLDGGGEYLRMGGNIRGYTVIDKGNYRTKD